MKSEEAIEKCFEKEFKKEFPSVAKFVVPITMPTGHPNGETIRTEYLETELVSVFLLDKQKVREVLESLQANQLQIDDAFKELGL